MHRGITAVRGAVPIRNPGVAIASRLMALPCWASQQLSRICTSVVLRPGAIASPGRGRAHPARGRSPEAVYGVRRKALNHALNARVRADVTVQGLRGKPAPDQKGIAPRPRSHLPGTGTRRRSSAGRRGTRVRCASSCQRAQATLPAEFRSVRHQAKQSRVATPAPTRVVARNAVAGTQRADHLPG